MLGRLSVHPQPQQRHPDPVRSPRRDPSDPGGLLRVPGVQVLVEVEQRQRGVLVPRLHRGRGATSDRSRGSGLRL